MGVPLFKETPIYSYEFPPRQPRAFGEVVEIGFSGRPWYCGSVALADLPGRWFVLGMDEVVHGETGETAGPAVSLYGERILF